MKHKWVKGVRVGADKWQFLKTFVDLPSDFGLNSE